MGKEKENSWLSVGEVDIKSNSDTEITELDLRFHTLRFTFFIDVQHNKDKSLTILIVTV